MVSAWNRTMIPARPMLNTLPRILLGAVLLLATTMVYASGGSWVNNQSGCSPGAPGAYYKGVCKNSSEEASDGKVVFDAATGLGTAQDVVGGFSQYGNASSNTVTVLAGETKYVYGGYGPYGEVAGNTVRISGGSVAMAVYGGYSMNGQASDNSVTVSGGLINRVYGAS